jgi:invasion protein IalB
MHKLILAILCLAIIQPALAEDKKSVPTFGNWGKACEEGLADAKDKQGPEVCYIFQNVSNKDNGKLVMQMRIGMAPQNDKPVLIVTLPLGVLLPPGAAFVVEGHEKEPLKLPFLACAPEGCTTVGQIIDDKLLKAMKKAEKAAVRVALLNRQVLTLPVSLKGFTRAYIALNKK